MRTTSRGWTVLAAAAVDPRVAAVVAMAPGGSEHPVPGVLRLPLTFDRSPAAPALFLAGENDDPVPLDDVGGDARLTAPAQAHDFVRALTLAHLDAHLRSDERARTWLASGVAGRLAARGIEVWEFPDVTDGSRASSS